MVRALQLLNLVLNLIVPGYVVQVFFINISIPECYCNGGGTESTTSSDSVDVCLRVGHTLVQLFVKLSGNIEVDN